MSQPEASRGRKGRGRPLSLTKLREGLIRRAVAAGVLKTLLVSGSLALAPGGAVYRQWVWPLGDVRQQLRAERDQLRKQNLVARVIKETRPEFIKEWRRLLTNYFTARQMLPDATELSAFMASLQEKARRHHVQIARLDASTQGVRSTSFAPVLPAAQPPQVTSAPDPGVNAATAQPGPPEPPPINLNERVIPALFIGDHPSIVRLMGDIAGDTRIIHVRNPNVTALNRQENVELTLVTFDAPTSAEVLSYVPPELRSEFQDPRVASQ